MLTDRMMGSLEEIQAGLCGTDQCVFPLYVSFDDLAVSCRGGCQGECLGTCEGDCAGSCEGDCAGRCSDGCTDSSF